jgi:hypothetical protein
MVWVSGTALTVTTGAAYIPSLGKVLRATSDIAKTGLSLTASTWYHVYLYDNAGTPDVEIVTTAPAAPYNGTARAKTGDMSRRYVGSVKTDSGGNILRFSQCGNHINYIVSSGSAPSRILALGVSTTDTTISVSAAVPVTSSSQLLWAINTTTNTVLRIGNPTAGVIVLGVPLTTNTQCVISADAAQNIYYNMQAAPTSGGAYIDVLGYDYER